MIIKSFQKAHNLMFQNIHADFVLLVLDVGNDKNQSTLTRNLL